MTSVVVQPQPGIASALGLLVTDVRHEFSATRVEKLSRVDPEALTASFAELEDRGRTALGREGVAGDRQRLNRSVEMRYVGQGHEITVPLPVRDLTAADATALRETFEREYSVLFRRPIPGAAIEVLSWSVLISTQAERPIALAPAAEKRAPSPDGKRSFHDGRAGATVDVPFYRRERMEAGVRVAGPAIIAEDETSTFITASFDARIDAAGCIVMERRAG